jgi:hypothetical protein
MNQLKTQSWFLLFPISEYLIFTGQNNPLLLIPECNLPYSSDKNFNLFINYTN